MDFRTAVVHLFFNLSLAGELKSDKEEMASSLSSSAAATFLSTFAKLPLLTDEMSDKRRSFKDPDVGGLT